MQVGMTAMRGRRMPGAPFTGLDVQLSGAFPTDSSLLARAVSVKLRKGYGGYDGGDLWLLAYTHVYPAIAHDDAVVRARRLLNATHHPFAALWAFCPILENTGVAVKVFP
jgi:hypothetical protein